VKNLIMQIEKLNGTNKRMYRLIAPFAMNRAIIRQNGGVPMTTSEKHVWYVAITGRKTVGFLSLTGNTIKNDYYNDTEVLEQLLRNLMSDYPNLALRYVASTAEFSVLEKLGFVIEKRSTNYFYMKYERKKTV
jgi:hypothetical protein